MFVSFADEVCMQSQQSAREMFRHLAYICFIFDQVFDQNCRFDLKRSELKRFFFVLWNYALNGEGR